MLVLWPLLVPDDTVRADDDVQNAATHTLSLLPKIKAAPASRKLLGFVNINTIFDLYRKRFRISILMTE